jgi:hypothetical protein
MIHEADVHLAGMQIDSAVEFGGGGVTGKAVGSEKVHIIDKWKPAQHAFQPRFGLIRQMRDISMLPYERGYSYIIGGGFWIGWRSCRNV